VPGETSMGKVMEYFSHNSTLLKPGSRKQTRKKREEEDLGETNLGQGTQETTKYATPSRQLTRARNHAHFSNRKGSRGWTSTNSNAQGRRQGPANGSLFFRQEKRSKARVPCNMATALSDQKELRAPVWSKDREKPSQPSKTS